MNELDPKNILASIKEASPSHIFLISFFILPFALKLWIDTIVGMFPNTSLCIKIILVIIIAFIYLIIIIWITIENQRKNKLKLFRDKILAKLIANNWRSISFNKAKNILGEETTDQEIISTIESFPKTLRLVKMKDMDENKIQRIDEDGNPKFIPGVGRLNLDE